MKKRIAFSLYNFPSFGKKLQKLLDQGYKVEKSFKFEGYGDKRLMGDSYTVILVKQSEETSEETSEEKRL